MASSLKDIPPLLHDARLSECRWDRHLKTLELCFRCLRRNADGTPIEDSTVDLKLGGVERVVTYYSPASVTVKPSEFEPGSRIALADLEDWPHGAVEAHLAINSPQAEFDAARACVREALAAQGRRAWAWGSPSTQGPRPNRHSRTPPRRQHDRTRRGQTTINPPAHTAGVPGRRPAAREVVRAGR
ncbi:MAG TPA: hypothetical protein VKE74_05030 [Gemmataceae bacterium]|nr:hypothetical protein [Gemmataceae bacterium]